MVPILLAVDVPAELAALEAGVADVGNGTADEVAGEEATRYDVTLDTKDWTAGLPEQSIYRGMDVPAELDAQLWIDQDSRRCSWPTRSARTPPGPRRCGWSAWGEPVDVEAPEGAKPVR